MPYLDLVAQLVAHTELYHGVDISPEMLGSARRAPGVGAGGHVVTLVVQAGSRCPIHPQLSTGFPASPGYPHLVDNRPPDRYS